MSQRRMLLNENQIRWFIKGMLNEVTPPDGIPASFEEGGVTYTYDSRSGPKHVYKGNDNPQTQLRLSSADAKLKNPKGAAPSPPPKKSTAKDNLGTPHAGDVDEDFGKLNSTLRSYYTSPANGVVSYGTAQNVAVDDAIKAYDTADSDKKKQASTATIVMLNSVIDKFAAKIAAAKSKDATSLTNKLTTAFGFKADANKTFADIYNETTFRQIKDNIAGDQAVQTATNAYLTKFNSLDNIGINTSNPTPDTFAKYLTKLAESINETAPIGAPSFGGGGSPTDPGSSTTPASDMAGGASVIQAFIKQHAAIAQKQMVQQKYPTEADVTKVLTGPFGPGSAAATAGFIKAVLAGAKADRSFTGDSAKANDVIKGKLDPLATMTAATGLNEWKGLSYMGQDFPGSPEGLVQFLKFAYIMRCGDSAKSAATTMGYSQEVSNLVTLNVGDTALTAARTIGALAPTAYIVIKGPSEKIPKGAKLAITESIDQGTTTAALVKGATAGNIFVTEFISDYPNGLRLVLGLKKGDSDGGMTVDHGGADAAAIVTAGLKEGGSTLSLMIGEEVYTLSNQTYKLGSTIDFAKATSTGPGGASGGPDFGDLAGLPASGADVPGMSQEGPIQFSMRSIYPDKSGKLATADVSATINKDVKRGRDRFTLETTPKNTNPNSFFLIPVRLRRTLQEGAHWSLKMIDTGEQRPDVVLVPATKIEYNFKGNKINYGTTFDNLQAVDTVFYSGELTPDTNLNVMTADQLLGDPKLGLTQADLDKAVISYLSDEQNPIGGSMLRSASLHNAMNTYRRAAPITF